MSYGIHTIWMLVKWCDDIVREARQAKQPTGAFLSFNFFLRDTLLFFFFSFARTNRYATNTRRRLQYAFEYLFFASIWSVIRGIGYLWYIRAIRCKSKGWFWQDVYTAVQIPYLYEWTADVRVYGRKPWITEGTTVPGMQLVVPPAPAIPGE